MVQLKRKYLVILILILLASCSGTKHLPEGEKLYTGASIELESTDRVNSRRIKKTAKKAIRPSPNKSFLGMRPKLWLYMAVSDEPKTKFGNWLKAKGEPPVLMSSVRPSVTSSIIDAELFNIGIFRGYTEFKTVERRRTEKVIYTSHIHKPYTISSIKYSIAHDSISHLVDAGEKNSYIKPGADYNLDLLRGERLRIDALLKEKGYFYFNPDYILFRADTSAGDNSVSITFTLKDSIPTNALAVYRIGSVFINQDYTLSDVATSSSNDTIMYQNYVFAGSRSGMKIKPRVILESVYLKEDELYSRHKHAITLNRLMSMGNFKFVQVKFTDSHRAASGFLDVTILTTTMTSRTFRAEMDIITKSNDFSGPRLNLSLLNRNTFRGAELLSVSMAGSYEAQFSGKGNNLYSYSLNPQAELTFPRLIVPFTLKRPRSPYVPKTRLSLSYSYQKRVDYFDMQTLQLGFGYRWRENLLKEHEFNPVSLSFSSMGNQSDEFTQLLNENLFLKKSYEEQFIAGGNYSITYNQKVLPAKRVQFYFHATAETAGNLFSLAKLIGGEKPTSENPSTLMGAVYSQFARLSLDARGYLNLSDINKLAARFFVGVAQPYGNSSILPYSKQFFSGGANSIRAFQINSVGPGIYHQENSSRSFLHLGGDIKLEANAEYRFTIYRFLKGALFVDAGNIWMQETNPAVIGSPFHLSEFLNELAVGVGVGIRIDVSFFILRFDLATPIRKPWLDANHRWVANQIDFTDPAWRTENLVLNIAIGYPF